ncbi:MAG TPA: hypothetical protein VFA70_13210 [Dehalococcoidia bacterium]|jgi:hypothetical protein|nr:hypothetical protein [Dehalococcoidia bacterium]
MVTKRKKAPKPERENIWITPDEMWEIFDQAARRELGMSGEEFRAAWLSGAFGDDPDTPSIMSVAFLLPHGEMARYGKG